MKLQHLPLLLLFLTSTIDSGESQDYYTEVTPDKRQVLTGDTVTLRCDVKEWYDRDTNVTGWSFYWSKDSDAEVRGSSTKTLINVNVSDGGEYRCRAASDHHNTSRSDSVTLTVLDYDTVVTVSQSSVFTGDTVTLSCDLIDWRDRPFNVAGWSFYWWKDSDTEVRGSSTKTLINVNMSDGGQYFCRAASDHHSSSRSYSVTLTVLYYFTVVTVSQSSVFTGDTVTLRCDVKDSWNTHSNVTGWSFYWSKDSDTEVRGSSTKTLINVKVSDGGEYRCRGTSDHHNTSRSDAVTLTVLASDPQMSVVNTLSSDGHSRDDRHTPQDQTSG